MLLCKCSLWLAINGSCFECRLIFLDVSAKNTLQHRMLQSIKAVDCHTMTVNCSCYLCLFGTPCGASNSPSVHRGSTRRGRGYLHFARLSAVRDVYLGTLRTPRFSVEVAVTDGFCYVLELYVLATVEVGNGAGYL